jgi:hypothetical protein
MSGPLTRIRTMARWPPGLALTAWAYTWRITPMHRRETSGELPKDGPPPLPAGTPVDGVQGEASGHGPLLRRRYRVDVVDGGLSAEALMERIAADINEVVPWGLAHFERTRGADGPLALHDEFAVRMPGPWDGPVRVIERTPTSWRFATLDGHLEAGQIEWRAKDRDGALRFEVESWSRPGDRLSHVLHHRLRMAKEVQLHMWTSVLEHVTKLAGGRMREGISIRTRVAD